MSKELTEKDIMPFGKYKGLVIGDIADFDPNYLCWMLNNTSLKCTVETQKRGKRAQERKSIQQLNYSSSPIEYDYEDDYDMYSEIENW